MFVLPHPVHWHGCTSVVLRTASGGSNSRRCPLRPFCSPHFRPDCFFRFGEDLLHGGSDDGGRDEFDEFWPMRTSRFSMLASSSAIFPSRSASWTSRSATIASNSAIRCAASSDTATVDHRLNPRAKKNDIRSAPRVQFRPQPMRYNHRFPLNEYQGRDAPLRVLRGGAGPRGGGLLGAERWDL